MEPMFHRAAFQYSRIVTFDGAQVSAEHSRGFHSFKVKVRKHSLLPLAHSRCQQNQVRPCPRFEGLGSPISMSSGNREFVLTVFYLLPMSHKYL